MRAARPPPAGADTAALPRRPGAVGRGTEVSHPAGRRAARWAARRRCGVTLDARDACDEWRIEGFAGRGTACRAPAGFRAAMASPRPGDVPSRTRRDRPRGGFVCKRRRRAGARRPGRHILRQPKTLPVRMAATPERWSAASDPPPRREPPATGPGHVSFLGGRAGVAGCRSPDRRRRRAPPAASTSPGRDGGMSTPTAAGGASASTAADSFSLRSRRIAVRAAGHAPAGRATRRWGSPVAPSGKRPVLGQSETATRHRRAIVTEGGAGCPDRPGLS